MIKLKYPTSYEGELSDVLSRIAVVDNEVGPRTHKQWDKDVRKCPHCGGLASPYSKIQEKEIKQQKHELMLWKDAIKMAVRKEFSNSSLLPPFVSYDKGNECYFYMVFHLLNKPVREKRNGIRHNPYRDKDVDNLVKAAVDAVKDTRLVVNDDKFIKGIKVYKEPVKNEKEEGLSFQCITTRTFTIKKVEEIAGKEFMPHWNSPMQYITTNEGKFIDNLTGRIFIARTDNEEEQYHDAVPGYDWKSKEGQKVSGCMVFKRTHSDGKGESKISRPFHWLHKWAWW